MSESKSIAGAPVTSRSPGRKMRSSSFTLFREPAYRRLWAGAVLYSLSAWSERLAVGWLVLTETDSILAAAATMAFRSAPGLVIAPFAGAIADRWPRQRVLKLAAAGQAIAVGATGIVAMDGISSAWSVLPIVGLSGVASAFVHPSLQALTADVAGPGRGLAGISLQQTGSRAIGVLGALLAGIASDQAGAAPALFGAAGVYAVSAVVMGRVKVNTAPGPVSRPRLLAEVASGVRVMASTPPVAVLLVMAMVVEMFGFAYNAVLPAVARDVLHVRAAGYGSLSFMAGIGAVAGVTVLSLTANRAGRSATLVAITIGFGCALIAFAASSSFALSLALVTCIGAMAAMFDSMQWALLQANVPDAMRGRAVAAWVFAIGFGWVGHLSLGVMAEEVSVRWALAASGGTVIVTGVLALFVFRRIRVA